VPVSLSIWLVIWAIALLAFGYRSTGGAIRILAGFAALAVAIAATAGAIGLFWLGQKSHWSSDGPGALFIMIGLGLCAVAAVVGWKIVFGVAAGGGAPVDATPSAPEGVQRVLRRAGFALLAIAVVGQAATAFLGRGRTAHGAPVVAVSFTGKASLVSVDAAGTLVDWDLHSKRETRRWTIPEIAGATELFVDGYSGSGFGIANGNAIRFSSSPRARLETIRDGRHVARGAAVVVARDQALLFVSDSDWTKPPDHEIAWPRPILAIAARDMFVAVADAASISLLDGRPGYVRTIASVPAPGPITGLELLRDGLVLALDGSGAGWAIEVRRAVTDPLPVKASLAAAGGHVFLVSQREVSRYDQWKKRATPLARIGSGVRSIDTSGDRVAFGFDGGEVVLGTVTGAKLETIRLTTAPDEP